MLPCGQVDLRGRLRGARHQRRPDAQVSCSFKSCTARDVSGWSPAEVWRLSQRARQELAALLSAVWVGGVLPATEHLVLLAYIPRKTGEGDARVALLGNVYRLLQRWTRPYRLLGRRRARLAPTSARPCAANSS